MQLYSRKPNQQRSDMGISLQQEMASYIVHNLNGTQSAYNQNGSPLTLASPIRSGFKLYGLTS